MDAGVLISDAQERSAAAACHILASGGYRVGAAASVLPAPGSWSRFCDQRFAVSDPREDGSRFAQEISEIVVRGEYAAVLPGGDASLLALSRHRDLFAGHVDLGLPAQKVVEACVSKAKLVEIASQAGLAAPETVLCETAEDARATAARFGFPLVLKPRCTVFEHNGSMRQRPSRIAWDDPGLERQLPGFGLPLLLQRCENGPVVSLGGVIGGGRLLGVVLSRYERTWPPDAGSVSFSETVEVPESLIERAERFLTAIGWEGIFEIEFIEHGRGSFATIDFNPRLYGSLALAARAGVPLPAIWCDWLLRGEVAVHRAGAGFHYRWEDAELRHVLRGLRQRRFRAVASIVRPRRRSAHAFFRWDDPGPLLARAISAFRSRRQTGKDTRRNGTLREPVSRGSV
jgi:predicted ATP-grasp superfamily ATP-dependent carboligase